MPDARETKSLAVLIDADNTSAKHAQAIFEEIVKLGEANVRRIYGDFSGRQLAGWGQGDPVARDPPAPAAQQFEGQEFLRYRAGDRRDGPHVQAHPRRGRVGQLGQRLHAARPAPAGGRARSVRLRRAQGGRGVPQCVQPLHLCREPSGSRARGEEGRHGAGQNRGAEEGLPDKARKIIATAIEGSDEDGWANLSDVGKRILAAAPDFDPRTYGCRNLSTLVEKSGGFEIGKGSSGMMRIRRKAVTRKSTGKVRTRASGKS